MQAAPLSRRQDLAVAPPPGLRSELAHDLARLLPMLRSRALRMTRDAALAEDIVQDAVERALRFEGRYTPGTHLHAWMQSILFSVFVSRCRRRRRERDALASLATDPCAWTAVEPPGPGADLSPPAARAVAALPPAFREVIELVDLQELSYRDAAQRLGVPLGTVMSRLHRARQRLARVLGGSEPVPVAA
jgi:RNA polymerase sigma-70 factor (ECF subfamily)